MNVLETTAYLLNWFETGQVFNIEKNGKELLEIKTAITLEQRAAILAGLKDLEGNKLLTNIKIKDDEFWVLNRPLEFCGMTIDITATTANKISRLINSFGKFTGEADYVSDARNISEIDILSILLISQTLINELTSGIKEKTDVKLKPKEIKEGDKF